MKNLSKTLFKLLFISVLSLTMYSCSSDGCDVDQAEADTERIQELSEIYIADIFNDEKCQDFVDAVRKFVSDYRDCDDVDQASIDSIESSISALPCA